MNRTIIAARVLAVVILVVFAMLMFHLYSNLKKIEGQRRPESAAPAANP